MIRRKMTLRRFAQYKRASDIRSGGINEGWTIVEAKDSASRDFPQHLEQCSRAAANLKNLVVALHIGRTRKPEHHSAPLICSVTPTPSVPPVGLKEPRNEVAIGTIDCLVPPHTSPALKSLFVHYDFRRAAAAKRSITMTRLQGSI